MLKNLLFPMFFGLLCSTSSFIRQVQAQTPSLPPLNASAEQTEEEEAGEHDVRFLTGEVGTTDYWPAFAPEGNQVVFSRRIGSDQPYRLYIVPVDGGTAKPFPLRPLSVGATRANWSWQSNEIAFTGRANGKNQIWVINGDGTKAHPLVLADLTPGVAYPSWDREGKQLIVVDYQGNTGGILKRIDVAQQRVTTLTDLQEVLAGMPAISPDGKTIAFAGQLNKNGAYNQRLNSIFLLNERHQLQEISGGQGRAPSWSPDGRWIAFESDRGNPQGKYAIYIVSPEGKQLRKLTANALDANHPVWSPDGRSLAFSALNPQTQTLGIATIQIETK